MRKLAIRFSNPRIRSTSTCNASATRVFDLRHTQKIKAPAEQTEHETGASQQQERTTLRELLPADDIGRSQIQLHRTRRGAAKREPDQFA